MTVQSVTIQLRAPSGFSAGQVTTGYYVVRNGKIIMTYADGEMVYRDPEKTLAYDHEIRDGDNVMAIAGILTKQVRREMTGLTEAQEEFGRPIAYPVSSIA